MKKKIIGIALAVSLAVLLAACGDNLEERVFEAEEMGIKSTLTYYHDDDRVVKQTAENVIEYDLLGLTSKEEAEEIFGPDAEQYEGIDGIKHEMKYSDDEATEILEINYDEVDYDAAKDLPGIMFEGDPEEHDIGMEQSAEMLSKQGFTEKE